MHTLKILRTGRKWTQQQVADMLGVDRTTYAKYESGASEPNFEILKKLSQIYHVQSDVILGMSNHLNEIGSKLIPVLGEVAAGIPIDAIENIVDYEEIDSALASTGELFGLRVKGHSMEPRICDGDTVIVRQQPDVDSGEFAVVLVNGSEATVKKIKKSPNGLGLIPLNPAYAPTYYTPDEIENLPVSIVGKVVELRGKF